MWTFGRKIAAGFTLSFLLLTVIGAVAYRGINSLTTTSRLVTHTHEVLEHISEMIGLLKDAETGQRGYIITGNDSFLEPYRNAVDTMPKVVEKLRLLTSDNPSQQKRLDEAAPLIKAKLAELQQTIDLRRKGDLAQTTRIVVEGTGKKFMDDLRAVAARMEHEERDLLYKRQGESNLASAGSQTPFLLTTFIYLLFLPNPPSLP